MKEYFCKTNENACITRKSVKLLNQYVCSIEQDANIAKDSFKFFNGKCDPTFKKIAYNRRSISLDLIEYILSFAYYSLEKIGDFTYRELDVSSEIRHYANINKSLHEDIAEFKKKYSFLTRSPLFFNKLYQAFKPLSCW